jgi:dihydroneopterin aldolase
VALPFVIHVAGMTHELTATVNYDAVYQDVRTVMEKETFVLLEALGHRLVQYVLFLFLLRVVVTGVVD